MIRRTSHFSGRVQGVGFRYTVQDLAKSFAVRGYVRNLPDGRVEMVVEGDEPEIARFAERIGEKMDGFIRKRTDFDAPATREFEDFSVRR
ncbi:MAG: acylphosphatase [Humisphaera sp.]|nr:acylphosphatase [Humisphaera sp.]